MTLYGYYIEYGEGERASVETVIDNSELFFTKSLRDASYNCKKRFCEDHNISIVEDYKFTKEV